MLEQGINRFFELGLVLMITNEIPCQRPHFHRMTFPAWGLNPRILRRFIQRFNLGFCSLVVRAKLEFRFGDAIKGMQSFLVIPIAIPAMGHKFLNLIRCIQINWMNFIEFAIDNGATRQQQIAGAMIVGLIGEIAIRQ